MVFSWAQTLSDAEKLKIRQAKQLAKNQDKQYKLKHPDESREADQGNYTNLVKRIKKEHSDNWKQVLDRRAKING